ncbi:hypothetical protein PR202_gb03702 [Eleusine coracana subsp. coracana]|uniref:KIB1-4 beta-propeller domain-containing protein n=1 Tax=Eleusine coracana subsp. coracana TaxID=191504 RepID=A0AAV5E247_ELECO|nr:hypothetical protein PR202_gb03702 [Eleusine coracana subsp. coracana]
MSAAQMMKRSLSHSHPKNPRPAPAMMAVDWSSLPDDLIRRVAHRFVLAADDLDYYMDFRAVCHSWRSVSDDPRADGTDPRFHPKNWAMLKASDERNGDVVVSFVNLGTGRFLSKNIPEISNKYFLVAATDGGLLVLCELEQPNGVCVVNPVSRTRFNEFWVEYPDDLLSMTSFAGDVYVTNRHGSIIVSSTDVAAGQERSAGTITMTTAIPAAAPSIMKDVHKVDIERKLLEPVESIGSRAIFLSPIRSISVDANMFPTVEAGFIYFVEPMLTSTNEHGTIISSHRLGHETVIEWCERTGRQVGHSTNVQVLGGYCMFIPISEPDMMIDGGGDFIF